MLKLVNIGQYVGLERWGEWIVSVPDDMVHERIEELMLDFLEQGDLTLAHQECSDEDDPCVDITDAPSDITTPDLTLAEGGEQSFLAALTTDQLQAELDRRRAKDSDTIVV